MKWLMEPVAVALAVVIVVAMIILLGGAYLKISSPPPPTPEPTTIPVTEILTPAETPLPETISPTVAETTLPPVPTKPQGNYAEVATPIRDPSPYKLPYYSTYYNPKGQYIPTIFHQSYRFNYQYEAVVAHVVQAPLIIDFATTPGSDTPIRSFFLITVRDNDTKKLLAQDGYFRTYSSNSPKRLMFSMPGTYHINMYGGFVTVDLTIRAP